LQEDDEEVPDSDEDGSDTGSENSKLDSICSQSVCLNILTP